MVTVLAKNRIKWRELFSDPIPYQGNFILMVFHSTWPQLVNVLYFIELKNPYFHSHPENKISGT